MNIQRVQAFGQVYHDGTGTGTSSALVDTLIPGPAWRKRDEQHVARKTCPEEFRRDAVELYRTRPAATLFGIAADLGMVDSTLSGWLRGAGMAIHPRPVGSSPRYLLDHPSDGVAGHRRRHD